MRQYREIYYFFSVEVKEELGNSKTFTHKLKCIDSFKFMWSSLSSLVNNLSEIYSKDAEGVKKEKKWISMWFYRLQNNKLHYKCNICKKRWWHPLVG